MTYALHPLLDGHAIGLRALEPEDLDMLYGWENDPEVWLCSNTMAPYSRYTLKEYIADARSADPVQTRQLRLMAVLKSSGDAVGAIDLYDIDLYHSRAGIGIVVDRSYRMQGIASDILQTLHRYVFGHLFLRQLYAHVPASNVASLALFGRCGYVETGRLQSWLRSGNGFDDVVVLQRF